MVIHLGPALLWDSSGLPEGSERATLLPRFPAGNRPPIWPCSGWGLPSQPVTGLLVRSYRTFSPLPGEQPECLRASSVEGMHQELSDDEMDGCWTGGIFSVALSLGSPPVGVTHHPAHSGHTKYSHFKTPRQVKNRPNQG